MAGITGDNVTESAGLTVTVERAGADELFRRYVRGDGNRCAAGDQPIGVCKVKSSTAGELVPVKADGIAIVEAGAAIVLVEGSKKVMPDATGRAIAHAGNVPSGGLALDAASGAGKFIRVFLNRA